MRYLFISLILGTILYAFRPTNDFVFQGQVIDAVSGNPLSGATILVKGTTLSASTDAQGKFSINAPTESPTLVFLSIGYDNQEITVKHDLKPILVKMKVSSIGLREVVVSGYGVQKRKDVRSSNIQPSPVEIQLQGRVAGISIGDNKSELDKSGYGRNKNDHFSSDEDSFNREGYDGIIENRFLAATANPLSTFSIDVDGASYSNVRRFLKDGQLPPAGAVRIEELINYFHYEYPQPKADDPFSINTEMADCPWNTQNKLVMIGLQGKKIPMEHLPASNLVFLIDVSGSMMEPNKLPLVQASMKLLVDQLREQDRVSLVVYAGNAGLVLPSTAGDQKQTIKNAIDRLEAGGSTAGGAGIQLAYKVAKDHFIPNANNRVILCTDGDFNVGASSDASLEQMIEQERKSGVYLTVLGYGTGNYQDSKMQKLADKGNGNHAYIDNLSEAKKVLVSEFGGTLFTIAKDVKLQIEFNPAKVLAYRLVGYENRMLNKEDFNNDQKDAGDLGSGHTVTALYEIIPVGVKSPFLETVDSLKYQPQPRVNMSSSTNELMTIKFRYKKPGEEVSKLIVHPVSDQQINIKSTSANFRFVAAVAQFGMLLRNSEFMENSSFSKAISLAKGSIENDSEGYRAEFLSLLKKAGSLSHKERVEEPLDEDLGSR